MSWSSNRLLARALVGVLLVAVVLAATLAASPHAPSHSRFDSFDVGTGSPLVTVGRSAVEQVLPVTAAADALPFGTETYDSTRSHRARAACSAPLRIVRPLRI